MKTDQLIKKYSRIFNTDYTQDANCQAAWLMDVNEDPITDSSQNTNTGAAVGDPTWANADPPKTYSEGYWILDGVLDRFDVADDPSLDLSGDFAIVSWIYPVTFGDSNYGRIADKWKSGDTGYSFYINNNPGGSPAGVETLSANIQNGGQALISGNANIISTGVWQHAAIVLDTVADIVTFYVDGVESGTPACADWPGANDLVFTIGDRNDHARQFNGRITQLANFDRTVDATEINDIIDNGLLGPGAPPYPTSYLQKNVISGYHCFMNAYLKASVEGFVPLKLPDGTVF